MRLNESIPLHRQCKFKSVLRVPSGDVLIARITSALVNTVPKFEKALFFRISEWYTQYFQWKFCFIFCCRNKTCALLIFWTSKWRFSRFCLPLRYVQSLPALLKLILRHHYLTNWWHVSSSRQRWQNVRLSKWCLFEDGSTHLSKLFDIWHYLWPACIKLWHMEGKNHTK